MDIWMRIHPVTSPIHIKKTFPFHQPNQQTLIIDNNQKIALALRSTENYHVCLKKYIFKKNQ